MSKEEKDKKNRRAGMLISAGSHLAVILLFIFLVAWRAPNPPLPEFGIELNFGTSDQGTGDIQPTTPAAQTDSEEDAAPDAPPEVEEQPTEKVEAAQPVEKSQDTPTESTTKKEDIQPVTEQPTEAPVKKTEVKPAAEKPVEKVVEKKVEPTPPKVLYPGNKDGAAGTSGTAETTANANQGDKTNTTGDQGDKDGSIDARALYGNAGGGGGSSLDMAGWMWDNAPDPKENTSESGKIVFEVIIDDRGEVKSVNAITYTVSASLMKIYQAEVEKLTFTRSSLGTAPATTKGKITFIINAK